MHLLTKLRQDCKRHGSAEWKGGVERKGMMSTGGTGTTLMVKSLAV
jgi:hypothetical protein